MSNFTLLWSKILDSSIWIKESKETRLVWITMLAMKDKDGRVSAAKIGLADRAKVSLEECEQALKVFLAPDPHDTSKVNEGRRIHEVPGGWQIVNHEIYRCSTAERREVWRQSQAEYRNRKNPGRVPTGIPRSAAHLDVVEVATEAAESFLPPEMGQPVELDVMVRFRALQKRLNVYYSRPEAQWANKEETPLLEIAKRPSCKEELNIILAHHKSLPADQKRYYPMANVEKLLEGWTKLLDTARMASGGKPVDPAVTESASALFAQMEANISKGMGDKFRVNV